jgi:non-heme chloroperoxidase
LVATALLLAKLLKNATLKAYAGFPHSMCTTDPEVINPDLPGYSSKHRLARKPDPMET